MLPMIQKRTEFLKSKSRQFGIDVGRAFDFFLGVVWEWFNLFQERIVRTMIQRELSWQQ